jgi:hypothetical protein
MIPAMILIYVPGDGQAHVVSAAFEDGSWLYADNWIDLPENELDKFIQDHKDEGLLEIDVRAKMEEEYPDSGKALPIIMMRKDISPKVIFTEIHRFHDDLVKTSKRRFE